MEWYEYLVLALFMVYLVIKDYFYESFLKEKIVYLEELQELINEDIKIVFEIQEKNNAITEEVIEYFKRFK